MDNNKTFTIIKPDAVKNKHTGAILDKIISSGFKIIGLKLTQFTQEKAEAFYAIHKGKDFFERLVEFMTSGPIVVAALEKENAVDDFRLLIGATNPEEAAEGTLRKLFATSMSQNAVHGSDSNENAALEISLLFDSKEIY